MRTIIELPEQQLAALDAWRSAHGLSRAEAVRRAVAVLLESDATRQSAIRATAGLWSGLVADGLEVQEAMRAEWDDR